ncbi:hypothetical protein [Alkaliphilus hydrothermalis]|uniref:DUF2007 domain-containing protein n=1 Tax=Alkaliphilus hydrothermalis TaxID=1482730 RepID=A0ABS2NMB7_9FIRM|nr:hypothetical protein [Alkaliphilus hydrothermalis]MBM7614059.1 hypothetical protein [Alkaliphilus hydrothermalis]
MPWCPKCKSEYREGFSKCNNCDLDLVEALEGDKRENINGEKDYSGEALLITVGDDNIASIIEAKLKHFNIPVLKRYKESGGYMNIYMGNTAFGIDLYVPAAALEEALGLIEDDVQLLEEHFDEPIEVEYDEDDAEFVALFEKKKRTRGLFILLLLTPGILWILVSIILRLVR